METSPRPLTVIQLLPALDAGGVERSTLEIARALVAAGHRSVVVSGGGRLVPALEAAGSTHVQLAIGRKSPLVLREIWRLRRVIAQLRPDIVHARSRLPAWIGRLALRGMKSPPHWITTVHGLHSPGPYSGVMNSGERVICVSRSVRDHVLKHYRAVDRHRLTIIARGIDPAEFPHRHQPDADWRSRFESEFPQLAGRPLLVLSGRGTRLKNHADAVRALALLATRHGIEAGLLMPGARERGRQRYLREIEVLADSLGVGSRVITTPPRDDIRDIYAIANIVLQLSNKPESFGRTALEALAIGIPVVGYAHGGVGELLEALYPDGAVPLGDVDALAAKLARVLSFPPQLPPVEGFTLAQMQADTLAVYREVAGDRR